MKIFEEMDVDFVEEYLKGSKILEFRSSSVGLEGGLAVKFLKDDVVGFYIMGYTEIGCWVYYFEHGETFFKCDTYYKKQINSAMRDVGFSSNIK